MTDDAGEWLEVMVRAGKRCMTAMESERFDRKSREIVGRGKGGDGTMVMDERLEDIILEEAERKGDINIVTEEAGEMSIGSGGGYLVIDPLDGSHNFAEFIPMYATSIAYFSGPTLDTLEAACIVDLVTGDFYTSIKGRGAWLNGSTIHVRDRNEKLTIGMELYPSRKDRAALLPELIIRGGKVRCMGSVAMNMAYLARGTYSAWLDIRGNLRLLDAAAGLLLVKEAGGIVTDIRGEPVDSKEVSMDTRLDLVASCCGDIHGSLLDILNVRPGWEDIDAGLRRGNGDGAPAEGR